MGPSGAVYAEDINPGAFKRIELRAEELHLANVRAIQGEPEDPKLTAGSLDGVLMVIAYHELANHEAMLKRVIESLKPGGRFVVVEMAPTRRPRVRVPTKSRIMCFRLTWRPPPRYGRGASSYFRETITSSTARMRNPPDG